MNTSEVFMYKEPAIINLVKSLKLYLRKISTTANEHRTKKVKILLNKKKKHNIKY